MKEWSDGEMESRVELDRFGEIGWAEIRFWMKCKHFIRGGKAPPVTPPLFRLGAPARDGGCWCVA